MASNKIIGCIIGLALLTGALTNAPAQAAQLVDFTNVAFAQVTGETSIPIGAADFCKRFASDCRMNASLVESVHLTPSAWQQLLDVNSYFNTTIVPETDLQLYHVEEYWTYPHGFGDCEDIALAKRKH